VLKSWLNRSLAYALAHDAVTLTRRHLERQVAPTRTLLNLAREIWEGEAALRKDPRVRDELRGLLGLAASPAAKSKADRERAGCSSCSGCGAAASDWGELFSADRRATR
jgi:hypothetical protein